MCQWNRGMIMCRPPIDDEGTLEEHESTGNLPLRRPTPGEHLTVDELEDELDG